MFSDICAKTVSLLFIYELSVFYSSNSITSQTSIVCEPIWCCILWRHNSTDDDAWWHQWPICQDNNRVHSKLVKLLGLKWPVKLFNKWKKEDSTGHLGKKTRPSELIWPRCRAVIKPYIVIDTCCMIKWYISLIGPETGLQPRSAEGRWVWEYFGDNELCYGRTVYCYSEYFGDN